MSHRLPEKGLWQVASWNSAGRPCVDAVPFDLIKLDLRGRGDGSAKGTVRARNLETRLGRIRLTGPDRFAAVYDIRGHRGVVEGTLRTDGLLRLDVSGTVTGTFVAVAAEPGAVEPITVEQVRAERARVRPARADASAVLVLAGAVDALGRAAGPARTAA